MRACIVSIVLVALASAAGGSPPWQLVAGADGRRMIGTRDGGGTAGSTAAPRGPARLVVKLAGAGTRATAAPAGHAAIEDVSAIVGAVATRPLVRPEAGRARFPRAGRASGGGTPPDFARVHVLDVPDGIDVRALARRCAAAPGVVWCEPDLPVAATFVPNDPYFATSGTWGQPFRDLWGLVLIGAPAAWDTTTGAGVVVAVVDTGVDYTHPDVAANVWTNPGEIPGNGVDDDGNGFVDDVHGWDFTRDRADPMDDHFHGTHVAGTIAAVANNGVGVVGVAPSSRIMAVKGLDSFGSGASSTLAAAIVYAVDNGADVINASWGGSGASQVISDAIAYAHAAGVVFVAAAGNSNAEAEAFFPAGDPNAITVAASTHLDARASFSNFGTKIDVTAPGGGDGPPPVDASFPSSSILSLRSSHANPQAVPGPPRTIGSYLRIAGTSMATPHVAGAAALVLSLHPDWTVEQVRQVLRVTADDVPPAGPDPDAGFGRLNVARAVGLAAAPLVARLASPGPAARLVGETVVAIKGTAAGTGFDSYSLDYGVGAAPTTWTPISGPVPSPVDDSTLGAWDVSVLADGDHILRLQAHRGTETFEDRVHVTVKQAAIDTPAPLADVRPDGPVEIRGTAAGAGFRSYRVEYRRPALDRTLWRTDRLTLASPDAPVRRGLLATLDASDLVAGDRFDFRLVIDTDAGEVVVKRSGVVIDPTLRAGWPQQVNPVADLGYLTVADLDGDGRQEILVGSGDTVVVFEPDGSIRPGWPQDMGRGVTEAAPLVADVIGDARPEVVAQNHSAVFVWDADGVLQPGFPVQVDAWQGGINAWIAAGDLDGDGKDDILCSGVGRSQAFRGDGSPAPGWERDFPETSDMPFAVANVVGDPRVETATYNTFFARDVRRHSVALRDPTRRVLPPFPKGANGGFFTHVGMADFDGDGVLDVAVLEERQSNGHFKAKAFRTDGRALRLSAPRFARTFQNANNLLAYADLDRNGRAEGYLYMRSSANDPKPYFLADTGEFVVLDYSRVRTKPIPMTHRLFEFGTGWFGGSVAIGDIDGDGVQELLSAQDGLSECGLAGCLFDDLVRRAVVVQRRDGVMNPQFPKPVPQLIDDDGTGGFVVSVGVGVDDVRFNTPAIADLDGDGLKEVVWVDPDTSRIFVWNVAGTPGPLVADWPMYHHDPRHSNTLPLRP